MKSYLTFSFSLLATIILLTLPFNSFAQRDWTNKTIEREKPLDVQIKKLDRTIQNKNDPPDRQQHTDIKIERPKERVPYQPFIERKDPIIKQKETVQTIVHQDVYVEVPVPKLEGITKFEEKDYFGALKDFNNAINNDTSDYELYYYRGLTHLRIKNYLDAINDFDNYLEYFFYEAEGYFQRGLAKFYLNEKQEVLEDFRIAADMGDKRAASIIRRFYY